MIVSYERNDRQVAAEAKTWREPADVQVDDDDDDDSAPTKKPLKRAIVSRDDPKAERQRLLMGTADEGVRCSLKARRRRRKSEAVVDRLSASVEWTSCEEDVFLAYARTAVVTMSTRLADPSVRHRSQTAVPENADDDQWRPYVERPAWKPRVSDFRTRNAFFQYLSRRPDPFIVLNV